MYEIREFDCGVRDEWRPVTNAELALIAFSAEFDEWEFFPLLEKETRDGCVYRLIVNEYYLDGDGAPYETGYEFRAIQK